MSSPESKMTPGGFEPPLPDRKSGVLGLTRRWGHDTVSAAMPLLVIILRQLPRDTIIQIDPHVASDTCAGEQKKSVGAV